MVRVSTLGKDRAGALAGMDDFITSMMQSISPQLRRVLMA